MKSQSKSCDALNMNRKLEKEQAHLADEMEEN